MTREALKNWIDANITNKTAVYSITPQDVGVSIKLVVDNGYNKDEGFGPLTEVSTANRVMVLDANGKPYQISTQNLSDILAVKGDSMSPVEPGPLPDGPAGIRRIMRVKAGTYTYGINKTYVIPEGQEGSLVWDGTTWETEYYLFPIGSYPIASISVNGEPVPIDPQKNVNIEIPDAPVQSISVNGVVVDPDAEGKVSIEIPDAPVQSVSVNGAEVLPDAEGNIAITIPDAPIQALEVNGEPVAPDGMGTVRIEIPAAPIQKLEVNNLEVEPDENGVVRISIPDAPIQNIRVNGDIVQPDGTGTVDIELNNVVDQTVDRNSSNAVSGAAVGAEIDAMTSSYGAALQLNETGEDADKVYSISLLDGEGNVLSTTSEFSGGGGGGEVATTKVVLSKVTENPTIKEGDPLILEYYYDHRNTADDSSTGLSARVTISIIAGATTRTFTRDITADTNNQIDVSKLLLVGNNTVRVRAEVDTGDSTQVSSISWRVQVVTLRLSSSFNFATLYNIGQTITVPYNLNGSGAKTLKLYVDGVHREDRLITTSSSNGSFTIATNSMSHGPHSIQMVAELEVGTVGQVLKSNSIYFDVAVRNTASQIPIVATRFDFTDGTIIGPGQRPFVQARKFENYTIQYAGYNPAIAQSLIEVTVANVKIASITAPFAQRSVSGRMTQAGDYSGNIKIGSTTYTFGVNVSDSQVDLDEPTDNLLLKLSALGRSNSDSNRTEWNYNGITTTLTGVQYAGDGWVDNALRLMNNGKAVINFKPLSTEHGDDNAWALTCRFKVTDVTDVTTPLIHCMVGGVGFSINAETILMATAGGANTEMKFAAGDEYNVAFVSMPEAGANSSDYEKMKSGMVFLYINGIAVGAAQRETGDNIYQSPSPASITFEGKGSTLDVYNIRCYNNYLTDEQVLSIFMIDLPTVDEILAKYEFNNIIDSEGDITVESLPDGTRYVIITGQAANGMSIVDYAAAMNNKDDRYDIVEALHIIKGNDLRLNFRYVGGCIRLQGTSSLAYPRKNYRLYFKNSAKQYGQLYVGVDAQGTGGTLDATNLFSMNFTNEATGKKPYPVDLWCFKADFAESSSSHNTGMARLTNDTLVRVEDKTPAQRDVLPTHPYDVRTTVDGYPCYIFERKTVSDKPKFKGKFNMNNDKATEQVFGFLDIPGYHVTSDGETPMPWVQSQFGGENPTECWEFLNNDFPMGMYLDDNFDATNPDGSPAWNRVFENRFPDNQDDYDDGTLGKPYYLERFVKWVKSTEGNPTKFRNELALYADVRHLCSYFTFTQWLGMVDQMVKNAMLGFWYDPVSQRMLAYYIFYDGDTILGVRNDGRLKYSWDVDRNTLDPELTAAAGKNVYAFMGHDSVLWNNLEATFQTELAEAYTRLRQYLNNDVIYKYFDEDQVGAFPERVYNMDAQYKYIEPKTLGVDVIINGNIVNTKYSHLEAMQGSRASHRKWWITNRSDLFDARFSAGQYRLTDITWKGISDAGATVSAVMSRDYYGEFRREAAVMKREFVAKNGTFTYTYNQTANVGTIFHLYGGKYFKILNLATWGGFTDLTLPNLQSLEQLILGSTSKVYTLSELVIGSKFPMLKMIDITNYTVLPSLNLDGCKKLEQVKARGTTNLGTIRFPEGAPLTSLILGTGLTTLRLVGLPFLTNAGITFPDGNNVDNLVVDSCPLINWKTLFTTLGGVQNIRITGINETGSYTILEQYKNLGGIDANGNIVTGARLVGTYRLSTYIDDTLFNEYRAAFPELIIIQAEYSVVRIYDKDPTTQAEVTTTKRLYNPDNNTGYGTPNPYVVSGHFKKILDQRHRYLGKQGVRGTMTICQLHDRNSEKFADNANPELATEALLDGQQGDIWIREPKYWYKGVTDYLAGVTYAAYSSNAAMPSVPAESVTKLIPKANMLITANRYVRRGFTTIDEAISSNTSPYSVARVDVSGYNKVKFTMAPYGTSGIVDICSSFTNEAGLILQEHRESVVNYSPGGDYIVNRPANAKYLYITIPTFYVDNSDFDVVLSNSTNPLDWNPVWIEVPEMLVSPFETSWINGKFRSTKTWIDVPIMSESVLRSSWAARNFVHLNPWRARNIKNLAFFKYGDTDMQRVTGMSTAQYQDIANSGISVKYGMQDTVTDGLTTNAKYLISEGVGGNEYDDLKLDVCLGYELLYDGRGMFVNSPDRAGVEYPNINGVSYTSIKPLGDRILVLTPVAQNQAFIRRLAWGPSLSHAMLGSNTGSDLMYYPDTFQQYNGYKAHGVRMPVRTFNNGIFATYFGENLDSAPNNRLVFEGNIVINNNVTAYKSIVEAV